MKSKAEENLAYWLRYALRDLENGKSAVQVAQGLRNLLNLYWRSDDR